MKAQRFTPGGRNRLVLLRGGLDVQGSDVDPASSSATNPYELAEWDAFAARIGWQIEGQGSDAEPAEDFEERLRARVLCASSDRLDGAREASLAVIDSEEAHVGSRRIGFIAAAIAVAAAALLVVATAISSREHSQSSSSPEPSCGASAAPSAERSRAVESPPLRNDDAPRSRDASPQRLVTPKQIVMKPAPPGVRVAEDHLRRVGVAAYRAALVSSAVPCASHRDSAAEPEAMRPHEASFPRALLPMAARENTLSFDNPIPRGLNFRERRFENTSWALSAETNRWLGVSVTPALHLAGNGGAGTAPGGIGVMAQLDLVKAFGNL